MPFNEDIVKRAKANSYFREVRIPPGGDIGEEVHDDVDQTLVFVQGEGEAILDGEKSAVSVDRLVHVPAGTRHNFRPRRPPGE